jgi:hypothetical protein
MSASAVETEPRPRMSPLARDTRHARSPEVRPERRRLLGGQPLGEPLDHVNPGGEELRLRSVLGQPSIGRAQPSGRTPHSGPCSHARAVDLWSRLIAARRGGGRRGREDGGPDPRPPRRGARAFDRRGGRTQGRLHGAPGRGARGRPGHGGGTSRLRRAARRAPDPAGLGLAVKGFSVSPEGCTSAPHSTSGSLDFYRKQARSVDIR